MGMNCADLPRPSEGTRSTAWTSDSRTPVFICARTDKLAARCHWAAFRFSGCGETATSFLGSESRRSISVAWYDRFFEFTHSAYAPPEAGSPDARSQHFVEHFRNASNRSEEILMATMPCV